MRVESKYESSQPAYITPASSFAFLDDTFFLVASLRGLKICRYHTDTQAEAAAALDAVCTLAYPEITNTAQTFSAFVVSSPHSSCSAGDRASFRPSGDSPIVAVTLKIRKRTKVETTVVTFTIFIPSALLRSCAQAALANGANVTVRWEQWGPKNTWMVNTPCLSPRHCTVLGWKACIWHNIRVVNGGQPRIVVQVFDFTPVGIRKARHEGACPANTPGHSWCGCGYLTDDTLSDSLGVFEYDPGSTLPCRRGRFVSKALHPHDVSTHAAVLMADGLFLYVCALRRCSPAATESD